jgi:translin
MEWESIAARIKADFEVKNQVREETLRICRQIVRNASTAIRNVHRGERKKAERLLAETAEFLKEVKNITKDHPEIYSAGFFQDAQKEYVEARTTYALIYGNDLPDPDLLGVEYAAYLNGVGEAVGELRRHILDVIREDQVEKGDRLLNAMDDIFYLLVSFDYPEAITGGLRRTTDAARAIMERTRGDLTTAIRQHKLKQAIRQLENKLLEGNDVTSSKD